MEEARKPENLPKNRYRDILPCKWEAYFWSLWVTFKSGYFSCFWWVSSIAYRQFRRLQTNFWAVEVFTRATRLQGTVQFPLQIALLFSRVRLNKGG